MKTAEFKEVHIDVGTGDGNYVYNQALKHPNILYIGIDPIEKQFARFAKKIKKQKLPNVILMRGSIEHLPDGLAGIADKITIFYPWGSLLEKVAKADLAELKTISKPDCELEIIFGYNQDLEPTEVSRLNLDTLDLESVQQMYTNKDFTVLKAEHTQEQVTSWAKRLRLSSKRQFFRLVVAPNW